MSTPIPHRHGGQIVVDSLLAHGVDTVFCVPGESFLPVLDALHDASDAIRLVVCRHESAASHMAEAYGKLTGKPGVCMVTRGPGATQASIGVHTASQDSTPFVLLIGQVESVVIGRDAWQEIDARGVFSTLAKSVEQFDRIERIPEMMHRAFLVATSDRPGPVVLAMPEDILYAQGAVPIDLPSPPIATVCSAADIATLGKWLAAAERPMVIVGGGGWADVAIAQLRSFVESFDLPVCAGFRRQDLVDNTHANYAGPLGIGVSDKLARRVREADLVLAVGTRLGETTTSGYRLLAARGTGQRLVHVHPARSELGRVHTVDLAIHSSVNAFADAAARLARRSDCRWHDWTCAAHADYKETLAPTPMAGDLNLGEVVAWLRERLPVDAIITNGAGNYTSWVHRFHQHRRPHTQLAPISGAMGYGIPAAIAAKLVHPDRVVVCFAGDGCFQMSAQELITARQYGLAILYIVVNNGIYGSIRMHQEMNFPGKVYGTDLLNPDFQMLAQAHGLEAFRVTKTADFAMAFEAAMNSSAGALIELRTDPQSITPRTTLHELRRKAMAR